jgi:CDI immunity proteins
MPDEPVQDDLSLEQIEDEAWGDPPDDATTLMTTVHNVRRKPIGSLTAEDLRVLVGQKVGLDVLVPRTLARLEQEPLLEGDFYPGDVLAAVLRVPPSYWSGNPEQLTRLERVISSIRNPDADLKADIEAFRDGVRS